MENFSSTLKIDVFVRVNVFISVKIAHLCFSSVEIHDLDPTSFLIYI